MPFFIISEACSQTAPWTFQAQRFCPRDPKSPPRPNSGAARTLTGWFESHSGPSRTFQICNVDHQKALEICVFEIQGSRKIWFVLFSYLFWGSWDTPWAIPSPSRCPQSQQKRSKAISGTSLGELRARLDAMPLLFFRIHIEAEPKGLPFVKL